MDAIYIQKSILGTDEPLIRVKVVLRRTSEE